MALTVSVVLNRTALPVAWHLVPAQASLSWMAILCRLLELLAPAVPPGMEVHVLCDRVCTVPGSGAGSGPGLAPLPALRPRPDLPARGTVRSPAGGGLGRGRGHAVGGPRGGLAPPPSPAGTLVVLHGAGHEHPWVLLTDTPPDRTEVTLYACRDWIEQGFRGLKRAGWQWQRTRRTNPLRAGRHWNWCWPWPRCWRSPTARAGRKPPPSAATPHGMRAPPATVPDLDGPPPSQPPAPGHGRPGRPAGPGALVDAALAPPARPYGPPAVRALAQGP